MKKSKFSEEQIAVRAGDCSPRAHLRTRLLADMPAVEMEKKSYVFEQLFGDDPQKLVAYIPHCGELSLTVLHAGPRQTTLKIPYQEKLIGDPLRGVVFGGVITTLLDQAGGIAVFSSLEELRSIATIDLRIDYVRPATPGRDLIGYAHCYRIARHVAFVRGGAYHDHPNDPFATFLSTYMLGGEWEPQGARDGSEEQKTP